MLVKLKFEREALAKALNRNEAMGVMDEGDQAATDQLTKWKTRLEQDENWPYLVGRKSSRTSSTSIKIDIPTMHFSL